MKHFSKVFKTLKINRQKNKTNKQKTIDCKVVCGWNSTRQKSFIDCMDEGNKSNKNNNSKQTTASQTEAAAQGTGRSQHVSKQIPHFMLILINDQLDSATQVFVMYLVHYNSVKPTGSQ